MGSQRDITDKFYTDATCFVSEKSAITAPNLESLENDDKKMPYILDKKS